LRHAFASRLVTGGHSLYVTQKLLGHETPSMTMRYAHLADSEPLTITVASAGRPELGSGTRRDTSDVGS